MLTDHLGSTRVVVDGVGNIKERNDYYPFGARHVRSDYPQSANRFKFNGKEEQTTGLTSFGNAPFLDYGARMYDPALARWFNPDPMAEEYYGFSPYNYTLNNPIRFIDTDGRRVQPPSGWEMMRYDAIMKASKGIVDPNNKVLNGSVAIGASVFKVGVKVEAGPVKIGLSGNIVGGEVGVSSDDGTYIDGNIASVDGEFSIPYFVTYGNIGLLNGDINTRDRKFNGNWVEIDGGLGNKDAYMNASKSKVGAEVSLGPVKANGSINMKGLKNKLNSLREYLITISASDEDLEVLMDVNREDFEKFEEYNW